MERHIAYRGFQIDAVVNPLETGAEARTETASVGFMAELTPDGLPATEAAAFLRRYPTGRFTMSLGILDAPLGAKIEAWAPGQVVETAKNIIDVLLRTLIG